MNLPQSAPNEAGLSRRQKCALVDAGAVALVFVLSGGVALYWALSVGFSTRLAVAIAGAAGWFTARPVRGYADALEAELSGLFASDVDVDDRVADLRARYVRSELSLSEFEARVGLVLDADASHLRTQVERVDGVGPATSAAIASRFTTVEAVREADVDELEAVDGVGPERAAAIDAELGGAS